MVFTSAELPKFTTHLASFIPTAFGGHVLVYESRSHPGHRREFAFKTRFTNQSGVSSCYYRCMSCRSMKNKVPVGADGKPPQIPCIAVKNGYIVNDPDFPEANDHFCVPPTIEESKQREANGFAKAIVKGRPRQKGTRAAARVSTVGRRSREVKLEQQQQEQQQPLADQIRAYQEMASALMGGGTTNGDYEMVNSLLNLSLTTGIDIGILFRNPAFLSLSGQTENGNGSLEMKPDDECSQNGFEMNGNNIGQRADDDGSDAAAKANNLLASLISTEPALRTDLLASLSALNFPTMQQLCDSITGAQNDGDEQQQQQQLSDESDTKVSASPESYMAMMMSSMDSRSPSSNSSVVPTNNGTPGIHTEAPASVSQPHTPAPSNGITRIGRKRKANSGNVLELQIEEIHDRYIINNWQPNTQSDENAMEVAELTCALILSLAHRIPQINASLKQGNRPEGNSYEQVTGKTLGIIGLNAAGLEVAKRMQGFGMRMIAYDPNISYEDASKRGVKLVALEQIWSGVDYLTLHVPLIPQTKHIVCSSALSKCRKGVRIVNLSSGGVIKEADLLDALNTNRVEGVAINLATADHCAYRSLPTHKSVICVSQPSSSQNCTTDCNEQQMASSLLAINDCAGRFGAINAGCVWSALDEARLQWLRVAVALSQVLANIANSPNAITIRFPTALCEIQKALRSGVIVGLMHARGNAGFNLVNTECNARKEGITVKEEPCATKEIVVMAGSKSVSGYPSPSGTILSAFNSCKVPLPILAAGVLAVNLKNSEAFSVTNELLKAKMTVECGLLGCGRVSVFNDLDSNELHELSKHYCVVKFS